jgi:hypothetical protein
MVFLPKAFGGGRIRCAIVLALAATAAATPARAEPVTFAQFTQKDIGATPFVYTNNGTGATLKAASFPIDLTIGSAFLPPGASAFQAATLKLTSSTDQPANPSGPVLIQAFPTETNTIQIQLDSPINGHSDFLTLTYTGRLYGVPGSGVATLTGSTGAGDQLTFTSGVIDLASATGGSFIIGLSSVFPNLSHEDGMPPSSFAASGSGSFSAVVPEPSTSIVLGTGLLGLFAGRLRRRAARS